MKGLKHTCSTQRNQPVGTNGRKQMADHLSGLKCLVLPMATRTAIENNFTLGRAYDIYFDVTADIKVGDKILALGSTFTVRHTQPFIGLGKASHLRAFAEQEVD